MLLTKYLMIASMVLSIAACGGGGSEPPVVSTPTIDQNPTAQADSIAINLGQSSLVDVLANDTHPEDRALTVTELTDISGGTAVIEDGKVRFTSGDLAGNYSFSYTIADEDGNAATAQVDVVIAPVSVELSGLVPYTYATGTVYGHWGEASVSADITEEGRYSLTLNLSDLNSFITVSADNLNQGPGYLKSHIGVLAEPIRGGKVQFNVADNLNLSLNEARTAMSFFVEYVNGGTPVSNDEYAAALSQLPMDKLAKLTEFLLLASSDDPALDEGFGPVAQWLPTLDTDALLAGENALPFDENAVSKLDYLVYWSDLIGDNIWGTETTKFATEKSILVVKSGPRLGGYSLELTPSSQTFQSIDATTKTGDYIDEDGVLRLTGIDGGPFDHISTLSISACDPNGTETLNITTREFVLLSSSQNQDIFLGVDTLETTHRDEEGIVCKVEYDRLLFHAFISKDPEPSFSDIMPNDGYALTLIIPDNESTYPLAGHLRFSQDEFTIKNTELGGSWLVDDGNLILNFSDGFTYHIKKLRSHDAYHLYFAELSRDSNIIAGIGGMAVNVNSTINTIDFVGRFERQWLESDYSSQGFTFQNDGLGFTSFNSEHPENWFSSGTYFTWQSSGNTLSISEFVDLNAEPYPQPVLDECPPDGNCVQWRSHSWEVVAQDGNLLYVISNRIDDPDLLFGFPSNPYRFATIAIYRREDRVQPPLSPVATALIADGHQPGALNAPAP